MTQVPDVTFKYRRGKDWVDIDSQTLFANKRVVVFALPGAFTPTCSTQQLPKYEELYDEFIDLGIEDVYCTSVNDPFVMNAWFDDLGIKKVKSIPDGNGDLAQGLGMFVSKRNLNFGSRSWRYALVVDTGKRIIEAAFVEPGFTNEIESDPFEVSNAETVLEWLKQN